MLKLWGRNTSINVQKAAWAVAETGLAFERVDVGGPYGGNREPSYLAMNPNGLVPVLQDDDLVLWESNAIVRYIAATHAKGLWIEDPAERALADRWMDWQATTMNQAMTPVFWGLIRTPAEQRDKKAIDAGIAKLHELFGILDAHLADRDYVAGARFTMGDIPVGAACYRYHALPIDRPGLSRLEAWYGRLQDRAAYREQVMIPIA